MVGHLLQPKNLAGASLGVTWINCVTCWVRRGFAPSISVLCAQAFGAGKKELVGLWFQCGLVVMVLLVIPIALALYFGEYLFSAISKDEQVAADAALYCRWSILGVLPQNVYYALQFYFQAQRIVRPDMYISVISLGLNVLLAYFMTKSMGFEGSPIATSIIKLVKPVLLLLWCVVIKKLHRPTWPGWRLREALQVQKLKVYVLQQSAPLGFGNSVEEWQRELLAFLAARLGPDELAVQNCMLSVYFFVSSAPIGLLFAVMNRVSFLLGASTPQAAQQMQKISLLLFAALGLVNAVVLVLVRDVVGKLFTIGSTNTTIVEEAAFISAFCGCCYLFLSVFYLCVAVLRGQARPTPLSWSLFIGNWPVAVPLAYVCAFRLQLGVKGLWIGMMSGYLVTTCLLCFFTWRSNWPDLALKASKRNAHKQPLLAPDPERKEDEQGTLVAEEEESSSCVPHPHQLPAPSSSPRW
eukprot:CAMPEP_0175125254 /NCGR_PEP_ID=MMETSP0087-20121206/3216_1 /TAXON_ID=136419 /ORGANISM="Unknown Unknown, Strain D1" /LENGTH=466 /DNA_ID=CAMNT_0016407075 /DNA_START=181 /DNA_END=1578 /DNA_ORIENTATION=+